MSFIFRGWSIWNCRQSGPFFGPALMPTQLIRHFTCIRGAHRKSYTFVNNDKLAFRSLEEYDHSQSLEFEIRKANCVCPSKTGGNDVRCSLDDTKGAL